MHDISTGLSDFGRFFPSCERNGVDQGMHNAIIHAGILRNYALFFEMDNNAGVVNMQSSFSSTFDPMNQTRVINFNNDPFAIVHQYDRLDVLQAKLGEKFVFWVNLSDASSEWRSDENCGEWRCASFLFPLFLCWYKAFSEFYLLMHTLSRPPFN
jgi:hypothetical protein